MQSSTAYAWANKALVLAALKRLGRKPWDADFDDLFHDGLLALAHHFQRQHPDVDAPLAMQAFNQYAAWLVYQDLLDVLQQQQAQQQPLTPDDALALLPTKTDPTAAETAALVAALDAHLATTARQVLHLRYQHDFTDQQIATILGLSHSRIGQIRRQIQQAYRALM